MSERLLPRLPSVCLAKYPTFPIFYHNSCFIDHVIIFIAMFGTVSDQSIDVLKCGP